MDNKRCAAKNVPAAEGAKMNHKIKRLLTSVRVIILLAFLLLAAVAIHPDPSADGVAIRSVALNSSASIAGMQSPKPTSTPMSKERIISINSQKILDISDFESFEASIEANRSYTITTNKGAYKLKAKPLVRTTVLPETEWQVFQETVQVEENGTFYNTTKNSSRLVNKTISEVVGVEHFGLTVYNAPTTNIRKGLDLQGGTRVLLQPEKELAGEEMSVLIDNMEQRLNVFGLSDIVLRESSDLSGNQYILVEVAGVNEEEVKELISKQGKFEAKIANATVFAGGTDITHVCRTTQCSGIDPSQGCGMTSDGNWACRFMFSITLTPEAAERQAAATRNLEVVREGDYDYLSEKIIFYLDDVEVDQLNIGSDLKGKAATDIQISGMGAGSTQQEAIFDSLKNMKRLQTILITGSMPVKLNIVKTDNLSPVLGAEFLRNAVFVGLVSLLSVSIIVFIRYRRAVIALPLAFSSLCEVIILMGFAALVGWNLDLAAIAGIIIAVGTGVDHQIVITDEILSKEEEVSSSWKQRLKKAFSIITTAYFTTVVAMVPLLFAGAGLLKGFALTTIAGITIGILITRPAYAAIIEVLLKQ